MTEAVQGVLLFVGALTLFVTFCGLFALVLSRLAYAVMLRGRTPVYVEEVSKNEWRASFTKAPADWVSGHTLWEAVGSAVLRPHPRTPIRVVYCRD